MNHGVAVSRGSDEVGFRCRIYHSTASGCLAKCLKQIMILHRIGEVHAQNAMIMVIAIDYFLIYNIATH